MINQPLVMPKSENGRRVNTAKGGGSAKSEPSGDGRREGTGPDCSMPECSQIPRRAVLPVPSVEVQAD